MAIFAGDKGSDGQRSLAYWIAYAELVYLQDSPAVSLLRAKAEHESQGEMALVLRSDHEMTALIQQLHDANSSQLVQ